ncbi:hypothetical protein D3C81_969090 [compost metagenome]
MIPVLLDELGSQLVTALRPDRHQLRGALHQAQEVPVARIAGVGQQPVLARIDQQAAGQQQGTGTARGDEDASGVDGQAVARGIEAGDGLAQLRNAARGGVAGMPGGERGLAGSDDGCGGREVGLADLEVDDVMARLLQFVGSGQQRHDMERLDGAATRAIGSGHN